VMDVKLTTNNLSTQKIEVLMKTGSYIIQEAESGVLMVSLLEGEFERISVELNAGTVYIKRRT
jgi:hypothetical protein